MKRFGQSVIAACLVFCAGCISPAHAGKEIVVEVDHSQMLTLPASPGAVVIGNPSIADVTTHGDKLFVHGRTFGQTNLIILDQAGNQIVGFDVIIKHTSSSAVALYKGTNRYSYSCAPFCEAEVQAGDQKDFVTDILGQNSSKTKFATGSETSEAKAPTAPQ